MDIIKLRKAGGIAAKVREEAAKLCVPGKTFLEIMDFCEKRILELGGELAWAQMSPTNVSAHFCPTEFENLIIKKGDLIKIDIGVHIDGLIADTAISIGVETNEFDRMINATKEALENAIKLIKPGIKLCDIGNAQMEIAEKYGFRTIRNLSGHNLLPFKVHGGINIPAYDNGNEMKLEEGMLIAIEPFLTTGEGLIEEKGNPNVFMQVSNKNTRSIYGRKLLPFIKQRKNLPFSRKDIDRLFGKTISSIGLRDLLRDEIIQGYPPLPEISNSPVSQFEHTMIITNDGSEVITR